MLLLRPAFMSSLSSQSFLGANVMPSKHNSILLMFYVLLLVYMCSMLASSAGKLSKHTDFRIAMIYGAAKTCNTYAAPMLLI